MKIAINGREFDFVMSGTVGPMYAAQRMLGSGEALDMSNSYHVLVFWYCILVLCNKQHPEFDEFVSVMTMKLQAQISTYVNKRWKELEGEPEEQEHDADKKKD